MSEIPEYDQSALSRLGITPLLPEHQALDAGVQSGLKQFIRNTLNRSEGTIQGDTAKDFIAKIADFDSLYPIFSTQPFRYVATPDLPEQGTSCTAESTVLAAMANMDYMLEKFEPVTFSAAAPDMRKKHAIQWRAPIDENYEIRVRGGSGAGAFSIDFGLGMSDPSRPHRHNELWRMGIDTVEHDGSLGTRFIRTGSAVKHAEETKAEAFAAFRKTYGMLPQRFLGIVGLYFMRELKPDYALALTTEGASHFSTLNKSRGRCNYTSIFENIGFQPSTSSNWSMIPEFSTGFYEALEQAQLRRNEADLLHEAVESLNTMTGIDMVGQPLEPIFPVRFCSDESPETIEREVRAHMR